jgi:serine/threonine protein kinase
VFPFLFSVIRTSARTNVSVEGTVQDECGNPHIAVKELQSAQGLKFEDFKIAENEALVLMRFRQQGHPHLITAIASYSQTAGYQTTRYFFVFPWARGGNLRNFWRTQPSLSDTALNFSPEDWIVYLRWFFSQLTGLAGAMRCLHYPDNETGVSCRHGDLKPENVLCFSKNNPSPGKIPTDVNLVVADAGHARVHEKATELRNNPTTTPAGTKLYCPPEAEFQTSQARPRRYDIWSLGCLYLEFLIWILYGNKFLGEFHRTIESAGTYYVKDLDVNINGVIKDCIRYIKKDPRCFGLTALGRLVDLIETRFLVVKVSTRSNSPLQSEHNIMGTTSLSEPQVDTSRPQADTPKPKSEDPVPGMIVISPTIGPPVCDPERADAKEICEELEKIFAAASGGTIPWINHEGMEDAEKRGVPQILPTLGPQVTQAHRLGVPGGGHSASQAPLTVSYIVLCNFCYYQK